MFVLTIALVGVQTGYFL